MKFAPLLALIALFTQISFAADDARKNLCDRYVSDVKLLSTPEVFRSAQKNHADLSEVASFMLSHEDMFKAFAQQGKDFEFVKSSLKKAGMPFGENELPVFERHYQKVFIAKNCTDANLEANSEAIPDVKTAPGTFPEPNDDFYGRHVDDATRSTDIPPAGSSGTGEGER